MLPEKVGAAPHKHVYQFLTVNVFLPILIYYIMIVVVTEAIALALSAIPPAAEAVHQMVAYRNTDPISSLQVLSIVLAIVFMCLTNDTRILFLKDSITTSIFGISLLVSTLWKENLVWHYYFQFESDSEEKRRDLLALHALPDVAAMTKHICLVWGGMFICEAAIRVVFIYLVSTNVMVVLSPCLALVFASLGCLYARQYVAQQPLPKRNSLRPASLPYEPPSIVVVGDTTVDSVPSLAR
ncbi:Aste57867_7542 [Aphanomyces stellatus]|uniref:Aste57867_7542 protein n=1 Tax=Aphanomyces stellatus TaxID=120398 RepID=A0A485KII0_9STRA|nr:hypothetical protein As57867_007516 [Aphanomyces stellatus]VFT84451.1 Aste57867_7542 [Aphanomyces stellatus]